MNDFYFALPILIPTDLNIMDSAYKHKSNSERCQLINAAGALLVSKVNPKRIRSSDIYELANLDRGAIARNFRSKTELFKAVYDELEDLYGRDIIRTYFESKRHLLSTKLGQAIFLEGLVDCLDGFFDNLRGTWREDLCLAISRRNPEFMKLNLYRQLKSNISSWSEIFLAISGQCDSFEACEKYSSLIMPIVLRFFCGGTCVFSNSKFSAPSYLQCNSGDFLRHVKKSLIAGFGLECYCFKGYKN